MVGGAATLIAFAGPPAVSRETLFWLVACVAGELLWVKLSQTYSVDEELIADHWGSFRVALWAACGLCLFSVLANLVYVLMDRRGERSVRRLLAVVRREYLERVESDLAMVCPQLHALAHGT